MGRVDDTFEVNVIINKIILTVVMIYLREERVHRNM